MKVAIYKSIERNYKTIHEVQAWLDDPDSGYVRISDVVEVEFTRSEDANIKEIAVLQGVKEKLQAKAYAEINAVQQRIDDLLALPDMS